MYTKLVHLSTDPKELTRAAADAALALAALPKGGKGLWHRLIAMHQLHSEQPEAARRTIEIGLEAFPSDAGLIRVQALCAASVNSPR